MKVILSILTLFFFSSATSQTKQSYIFIEFSPTGKTDIQLFPEQGVRYDAKVDSIVVASRTVTKKGDTVYVGKKYETFTELFSLLYDAGYEFVQFSNINVAGGGTKMLVGEMRVQYMIWKTRE